MQRKLAAYTTALQSVEIQDVSLWTLWSFTSMSGERVPAVCQDTQSDTCKKWVTDHFTPLTCINLQVLAVIVFMFRLWCEMLALTEDSFATVILHIQIYYY